MWEVFLVLTKNRNGHFWHGQPVTAEDYERILSMLRNPPAAPEGYGYRLTAELEWDLYALSVPVTDTDPELSAEEALNILLGGNV